MKKRILSLCMVLILCLGLLPATALAADGDTVYVGGVALTGSTGSPAYATTDAGGNVITGGATADNYNIKWDGSILTLHNATITARYESGDSTSLVGIYAAAPEGRPVSLTIELQGENNQVSGTYGIFVYSHSDSAATLNITGSGSLTANGSSSGITVQSNGDNATLTIRNVDVTGQSAYGGGVTVHAGQTGAGECTITLNVEGGSLTASGNTGIIFDSADPGTVSATNLTVSNNAIVRANDVISYIPGVNLQIGAGNDSPGGIVFDGSVGAVYGEVTLQDNLEISEGESPDIPGGASLTIPNNVTLTNEGTVTNSGTLTNYGTINNSGTLPGNIQGTAPPGITTTSIDDGTVGTAYSATLTATGNPTSWTWSASTGSALPNGLTLDESTGVISGTPTAQGTSNFTVTARNSGGSDSESLSITVNEPAIVSVTGVELDQDSMELTESRSAALNATVQSDNATNKTVTWSSDNPGVATVNNGVVTAHSAGTAIITVTTADQNKTATCAVTVTARTYNISATPAALDFGSVAAGYTAAPAEQTVTITNGGNQSVTLNQPTAEHYEIGPLSTTTLTPGTAATFTVQPRADLGTGTYRETITISGSDGIGTSLAASFTVSAIPVSGVSLDTGTLSLTEGNTGALTATVEPDNATNKP